ncbi:MAG: LytR/AlgR family response regulator transcription factor [Suilimivivens sp.]
MHIAICDDNIADRKQLERLLKRESDKRAGTTGLFYTDSFGNSELLSKNHMQYDLFFIDMVTEEPDGLTFALELIQSGVHAPIVLCSSKINYPDKASSLPSCPDNLLYMEKPIKTAELSRVLDRAAALQAQRTPTIELRSETDTHYVTEDDIIYAVTMGRYIHVFLKDGTEIPILTDMFNFYDEIATFSHMVLLNEHSLFNIVHMEKFSPFKVTLKNGVKLKSSPFSSKYIKSALQSYRAETL